MKQRILLAGDRADRGGWLLLAVCQFFLLPLVCWLYGLPLQPVLYASIYNGNRVFAFCCGGFLALRVPNPQYREAEA